MSLISKQSLGRSKYREFIECPFLNIQSGSECDETDGNNTIKNDEILPRILTNKEHYIDMISQSSAITISKEDSNKDLFFSLLLINNGRLCISDLNLNSNVKKSRINLFEQCNQSSRCTIQKYRSHSLPMISQKKLTSNIPRINTRKLRGNIQSDFSLDKEVLSEVDKIYLPMQILNDEQSISCDLELKSSVINLINYKSRVSDDIFDKVSNQYCTIRATASSLLSKLNKPTQMTLKIHKRFPFTICDNYPTPMNICDYNCVHSNINSINVNKNIDSTEKIDNDTRSKSNSIHKLMNCNLSRKTMAFQSWTKRFTKIFSSQFKKQNNVEQNVDIKVLFVNEDYADSSSAIDINKQVDYCCYDGDEVEFSLKERLRRPNCDNLRVQNILPVDHSNATDSRYSVFHVKKARDELTTTNKTKSHPPSAGQCQYHSLLSECDIKCKRLSSECLCFRIWNLFSRKSNESIMKK